MGFFDNIGKGISDFSQTTIQKGKDATSIVKINRLISTEEKKIAKLFENLGRLYYERQSQANLESEPQEGSWEESVKDCIDEIETSQKLVLEYQEEVKKLQGVTQCTHCGADVPEGASFCPECGQKTALEEAREQAAEKSERLFCASCGAQITPGFKFCASCGTRIDQEPFEVQEPTQEEDSL